MNDTRTRTPEVYLPSSRHRCPCCGREKHPLAFRSRPALGALCDRCNRPDLWRDRLDSRRRRALPRVPCAVDVTFYAAIVTLVFAVFVTGLVITILLRATPLSQ